MCHIINQDKRKEVGHEECPFSFLQFGNYTSQENKVPLRISTSCGTYSHYLVQKRNVSRCGSLVCDVGIIWISSVKFLDFL